MSMGDRIAVMTEGELQQVGAPAEVYDNPANLFVANFIGSPGMNFIDVVCASAGQTTRAVLRSDDQICFSFSKDVYGKLSKKDAFSRDLVLGIRPEWVEIDRKKNNGQVGAEIYVVEPLGSSTIIDLKIGNDIIKARTSADFDAKIGDKVWVTLNEKKVHFFDKGSGEAIYM
jgi:multiple sugar transport system ATP-binding protein